MNVLSDVGISPVLLQAINQTLTSTSAREITLDSTASKRHWKKALTMDNTEDNGNQPQEDIVSRMFQPDFSKAQTNTETVKQMLKMKLEPGSGVVKRSSSETYSQSVKTTSQDVAVADVLSSFAAQSQTSKLVTSAAGDRAGLKQQVILCYPTPTTGNQITEQVPGSASKTVLFDEQGNQILVRMNAGDSEDEERSGTRLSTLSSSNSDLTTVPTSRSHAIKTMLKMRIGGNQVISDSETSKTSKSSTNLNPSMRSAEIPAMNFLIKSTAQQLQATEDQLAAAHVDTMASTSTNGDGENRVIICYQKDQETGTLQLGQSVLMSENEILRESSAVVEQGRDGKIVIQAANYEIDDDETGTKMVHLSDVASTYTVSQDALEMNTISNMTVQGDPGGKLPSSPCPVCGDVISGYHYGIFTCESCKGFFKRTVQNKKTFVCHRQGECEITLENRKKCPACRFAKCLVMGMKLEAIRSDRTRGGRSSYGSPSNQSVKRILPSERKRSRPVQRSDSGTSQTYISIPETTQGSSQLVAILNNGNQVSGTELNVPQILTDIMNLESLLCDDELPAELSAESLSVTDPNVFFTLLQLTELKLYKIVRWARNLPYFSNISTDDQILLLQNCWCDLLTLTSCWRSIHLNNEILFFHGQSISDEKAKALGMGEVFEKMLFLIDHLRRLRVDQYEMVAIKVVILMSPDMKGLKDADKLKEQQEKIAEALEKYTSSHYRQSPNKFGEMLLRLPELSRVSVLLKEHLMAWMPENSTSCGLLFELLKGENMKDLG